MYLLVDELFIEFIDQPIYISENVAFIDPEWANKACSYAANFYYLHGIELYLIKSDGLLIVVNECELADRPAIKRFDSQKLQGLSIDVSKYYDVSSGLFSDVGYSIIKELSALPNRFDVEEDIIKHSKPYGYQIFPVFNAHTFDRELTKYDIMAIYDQKKIR